MADPRNFRSVLHVQYKVKNREMDKYEYNYLPDAIDALIDVLELDHVLSAQLSVDKTKHVST